jgi:uncharacterized membrane protein
VADDPKSKCQVCHKTISRRAGTLGDLLRPSLLEFIQKRVPLFESNGFICFEDLGKFRRDYVKEVLEEEIGELTALDHEVVDSLQQHEILSADIGKEFERALSFGERLSDKIADFGGSWTFISLFGGVLFLWIIVNSAVLASRAFDPYPFILMNLILSCLAAIQAPIIMMSQNRSEARDRTRAENDYKINLKAELEIRHLHEKIDHLLRKQYNRLFEIQQIQIELLEEIGAKRRGGTRSLSRPADEPPLTSPNE